jgi:hypothetical protein
MTRRGKHLTRWSGIGTVVALAATMVVFGCQKEGDGRKLSQSVEYSKIKKLFADERDQHRRHRRTGIQGGLWNGLASVFASVQRPNQTAEADPINSTSSYNNASDTSNSTVVSNQSTVVSNQSTVVSNHGTDVSNHSATETNHSAMASNHSALVPIQFGPLNYVGHSGRWYARYPLGVCEGDCDSDGKTIDYGHCVAVRAFLTTITTTNSYR